MLRKYDIVLVDLEPALGAEKRGVRPCVILQNNLVNQSQIQTVTLAPLTKTARDVPSALWIIATDFNGLQADSRIEVSQLRTVDRGRIHKTIGQLESKYYLDLSQKISNFIDLNDEYI